MVGHLELEEATLKHTVTYPRSGLTLGQKIGHLVKPSMHVAKPSKM